MSLDINHELFSISVGENVNMVLATSLSLDPSKKDKGETAVGGWREQSKGEPTLADMFEYVCHGKNYRFEDADGEAW
jgi:DNA-directed RNA polymerase I, II, and III subunit RPABC3